ncbi:DUF6461 domain-containing protein [Nonomuraea sp. JJY05]|uniref:DUF6461 domain-containing protein n=1 Tax=Nonomuraea sp. JJY05 TaxID=3350255 RepID=UPI00373ED672
MRTVSGDTVSWSACIFTLEAFRVSAFSRNVFSARAGECVTPDCDDHGTVLRERQQMSYWFDSEAVSVTYVRDLSAEQALLRMGATISPEGEEEEDEGEIAAFEVDGGVVLAEPNGFAATLDEVIARLSKDTTVATVFYNVNLDQQFVYAENGVVVTAFEPDRPDSRSGGDPDRLLERMRELGMETESDLVKAAELAQIVTGLQLPDDDADPTLIGIMPEYY